MGPLEYVRFAKTRCPNCEMETTTNAQNKANVSGCLLTVSSRRVCCGASVTSTQPQRTFLILLI